MKKFIFAIILCFFSIGIAVFGGAILFGCSNNIQNPDGIENFEPDNNIESQESQTFTVRTLYWDSSSNPTNPTKKSSFSIGWRNPKGGGNWFPGTVRIEFSDGSTRDNGTESDFDYVKYFSAESSGWQSRRYGVVNWNNNSSSGYSCFGVSTSSDNGAGTESFDHNRFFFYGSGYTTYDLTTAQNSCSKTVTGNYYINYRKIYSAKYYNYASGVSGMPSNKTIYAGRGYTLAPSPSRPGYAFNGWHLNSTSGTAYSAGGSISDSSVSGNYSWYAGWDPYTYKININILSPSGSEDGASGTANFEYYDVHSGEKEPFYNYTNEGRQTLTTDSTITISNIKPALGMYLYNVSADRGSYSDYVFTATGLGVPSGGYDATITIQMKWNTATITYNSNGGTPINKEDIVTYNSKYPALPSTTRIGYTFAGWYYGGNKITTSTTVTTIGNHTLVASWTNNLYNVKFLPNGGSGSMASNNAKYDSSIKLNSCGFSRIGYTFNGWKINYASAAKFVNNTGLTGKGVYENQSGYVCHDEYVPFINNTNARLTLNSNYVVCGIYAYSGKDSFIERTSNYATTHNIPTGTKFIRIELNIGNIENDFSNTQNLTVFSNKEYDFSDGDTVKNLAAQAGATVELYAQWKPKVYNISFRTNGGSVESTKAVTFHSTYGTLPTPTRSNCIFEGWYFDEGLSNRVLASTRVEKPNNHILYAKWSSNNTNILKYDSTNKYYYFEDGEYPQTYVGVSQNQILNGLSSSQLSKLGSVYSDEEIGIYSYNGNKYGKVNHKVLNDNHWKLNGNNYYYYPRQYAYTDKFTIMFDAYMPNWNVSKTNSFFSWTNDGGWGAYVDSSSANFEFYVNNVGYRSVSFGNTSSFSGWEHFAISYDGKLVKSYRNGVNISSYDLGTNGMKAEMFNRDIVISGECGWSSDAPDGNYFTGEIKNFEITNFPLDELSIASANQNKKYDIWFNVEPIRWRVSDYGVVDYPKDWEEYGSYKTEFVGVSDKILSAAKINASFVEEGWDYSQSNLSKNTKNSYFNTSHVATKNVYTDSYVKDVATKIYRGETVIGGDFAKQAQFEESLGISDGSGENVVSSNYISHRNFIPIENNSGVSIKLISNYIICGVYSFDASMNYIRRESYYSKEHFIDSKARYIKIEINIKDVSFNNIESLTLRADFGNLIAGVYFKENSATSDSELGAYNANYYGYSTHENLIYFKNDSKKDIVLKSNYAICGIYAFDNNKNCIKRCSSYTNVHSIPTGTYYIRVEVNTNSNLAYVDLNKLVIYQDYFIDMNASNYVSQKVRVVSNNDLSSCMTDNRAKCSDMAAFLMGSSIQDYENYWTRNIGTNLNNFSIITKFGSIRNNFLDNINGIRFSAVFSDGHRI